MTTVVGLKSGKEFIVMDKCYSLTSQTTGLITRVFITLDKKRLITVPPDGVIEYFDQPYNSETIEVLNTTIEATESKVKISEEVDPNVG